MRPRLRAAENVGARLDGSVVIGASMRPRLRAAENVVEHETGDQS